jgi:hypothetical protein
MDLCLSVVVIAELVIEGAGLLRQTTLSGAVPSRVKAIDSGANNLDLGFREVKGTGWGWSQS